MYKTAAAAIVCLGLFSCTNSSIEKKPIVESCHEYIVYIDNSFSEKRQDLIKEAGERWANEATDLHLTFQVVDLNKIHQVQYSDGSIVVINKDPSPELTGWTLWDSNWAYILIPNDYDRKHFRATAMHEFGHAFHLEHIDNPNAVMWKGDSENFGGLDISCDDLEEFCSKWDCKCKMICSPN